MIPFVQFKLGTFVQRDNRFVATVRADNTLWKLHVPNSGRMKELFVPGAVVAWESHNDQSRKTAGTLQLVEYQGHWVCINSQVPNRLLWHSWQHRSLPLWQDYPKVIREFGYGDSRFDLAALEPPLLLEAKSVTLVENEVAMFPDAPTVRGRKHLLGLIKAGEAGWRRIVVFIVQRADARIFTPHVLRDPAFAAALREAICHGVEIFAYNCEVSFTGISLKQQIPVEL